MNTRIRYARMPNGSFMSMRYIKLRDGTEVKAGYTEDGMVGTIISSKEEVLHSVQGSSPHKTKIAIKKKLIEMGAEFEDESRGGNE